MSLRQQVAFRANVKMVSAERVITAGPESAAIYGVPVGSILHTQIVKWHRNPLRQLAWRIRSRDFSNRIANPGSAV